MNNRMAWIDAQVRKGDELNPFSEYFDFTQLHDCFDLFEYLIVSPECNWEKSRTLLEQLLNYKLVEQTWQSLNHQAENWDVYGGQGIFLSELLTDFGAFPTAAALGALTTTSRLLSDKKLLKNVASTFQEWWGLLTRSLWGHGIEVYGQRIQLVSTLDKGGVLQIKQDDPWINTLRAYFKDAIVDKREKSDGWLGGLSDSIEALLRLGPTTSTYQEEIFARLEPHEQEKVLEAPLIKILKTHSFNENDLKELSSYRIHNLPLQRFRAHLKDLTEFTQDSELTYILKILSLREPILDLIQDSSHSLSFNTMIHETNMSSLEFQMVIGHLLKSGLIEMDFSAGAHAPGSWSDPDQTFQLSHLGSDLLAATSG